MPQPLSEPSMLIVQNCSECRGTGVIERGEATRKCEVCEGSGRQVSEAPMSVGWQMIEKARQKLVAPPPSMLRDLEQIEPGATVGEPSE